MVGVKICGITREEDTLHALRSGADYLGFILYPGSPRYVPPDRCRELLAGVKGALRVAVMVNPSLDEVREAFSLGFDLVQLHGEESPEFAKEVGIGKVIKAFRVKNEVPDIPDSWKDAYGVLLDTYSKKGYGGTGESFNWDIALRVREKGFRLFLSGGLSPENVREAVRRVRPFAVDVSSGIELEPGVKDKMKIERFIKEAKSL